MIIFGGVVAWFLMGGFTLGVLSATSTMNDENVPIATVILWPIAMGIMIGHGMTKAMAAEREAQALAKVKKAELMDERERERVAHAREGEYGSHWKPSDEGMDDNSC